MTNISESSIDLERPDLCKESHKIANLVKRYPDTNFETLLQENKLQWLEDPRSIFAALQFNTVSRDILINIWFAAQQCDMNSTRTIISKRIHAVAFHTLHTGERYEHLAQRICGHKPQDVIKVKRDIRLLLAAGAKWRSIIDYCGGSSGVIFLLGNVKWYVSLSSFSLDLAGLTNKAGTLQTEILVLLPYDI